MEDKKIFNMYRSYYEAAKQIPDKEGQADFLLAILAYGFDGKEPTELTGWAKAMYEVARPTLENSRKRAEAGSSGGSASKQTASKPEAKVKQNGSKNEANRKQTASKPEAIKEKGERKKEEGERMSDNPPDSPPKGAKPKQPKVQWAEFVTMTNAEHDKLLATYGPADTQRLIEILDNYKGSSGHKYQSDYRAILSWAVDRLKEEKARNQRQNAGNRGNSTSGNPFLGMLSDMEQDELNIIDEEGDT